MRLRDHYDWIVLGDHPGALLSASLAARLGLSVLVLPLSPGLGLTISRSGQYLDPESNYLMGVAKGERHNGLLFECLNRVGMLPFETEMIQTKNSMPQVLTPQSRLILNSGDALQQEFFREFGRDLSRNFGLIAALKQAESEYQAFWLGLPKRLTLSAANSKAKELSDLEDVRKKLTRNTHMSEEAQKAWVTKKKRVSEFAGDLGRPDLAQVCDGLWYALKGGVPNDPALPEMLHALSQARTSGAFRGGMTAYREFLTNVARRLGVQVPLNSDCRRIFIEGGRFIGVQIANRGSMIGGSAGILGCSVKRAVPRITYSGRNWFHRFKKPPTPIGWKFTLALTVHAEAIPMGMLQRFVWQERDAPVLEVEVVHPSDYGMNGPEHRIIFARTVMPFTPESLTLKYQRLVAGRMMRQLTELLPFVEFHVERIYPDFRAGPKIKSPQRAVEPTVVVEAKTDAAKASDELNVAETSIAREVDREELAELYGFATLDHVPDNLCCHSGEGLGSRSGVEGLYLASDESYPALGSLGGTVAAIESIASLAHRSGLAGPFV